MKTISTPFRQGNHKGYPVYIETVSSVNNLFNLSKLKQEFLEKIRKENKK